MGSDQVWRPIYADGHLDDFFLKFTEGKKLKRIGYAASFGVDYPEYDSDEKSMASALLKNFDAVMQTVVHTSALYIIIQFLQK